MNMVVMKTALKRVACLINSCPLAEKDKRRLVMGALGCVQEEDSSHPDYLESITANTLLLGRSVRDPIDREYELECGPRKRLAYIRRMEQDYKGITRMEITVAVQRLSCRSSCPGLFKYLGPTKLKSCPKFVISRYHPEFGINKNKFPVWSVSYIVLVQNKKTWSRRTLIAFNQKYLKFS